MERETRRCLNGDGRDGCYVALIYCVEDDESIRELVGYALQAQKFDVKTFADGASFWKVLEGRKPDLVLLDIMLPGESGTEILGKLRRRDGTKTLPVLMLTAKSSEYDIVKGLDLGADDYLPKPFSMDLLLARVRAMLRRREEFTPTVLPCGNITLNQQTFQLSKLEYRLMEVLILNKGIYLSTEDLLTKVWGYDTDAELGTVWVYLSYLRKRLTALHANVAITAKRGVGYTLEVRE